MNIKVGKSILDRSFLTGKSEFGKVERTSATISGVEDPRALTRSNLSFEVQGSRKEKS